MSIPAFASMTGQTHLGAMLPRISSALPGFHFHGSTDESNLVTLKRNTLSIVTAVNDLGRVDDSMDMGGVVLNLKRSPSRKRNSKR